MKPYTAHKMNRIKAVYFYVLDHQGATSAELANEFDVSVRTIQRDLDVLLYNELVTNDKRGHWVTTSKKVKRPTKEEE